MGLTSAQRLNDNTLLIPRIQIEPVTRAALVRRLMLRCSATRATAGSMIAMEEVIAANARSRKNRKPNKAPAGMLPKAIGNVTNIRPGPSPGARPLANTSGKITSPAIRATSVSAPAMTTAVLGMGMSWGK